MPSIKQHNTIGQLINRLTLQDEIKLSHSMVCKLAPLWEKWTAKNITEPCTLLYYKQSVLTVACRSSIGTTQLRHQSKSLLSYLHKHGFEHIEKVKATIQQPSQTLDITKDAEPNEALTKPSDGVFKSLAQCQKNTKSEKLSNALTKLNKTLKEL